MDDLSRFALHSITTKPWDLKTAVQKYSKAGVRGISIWKEALETIGARKAGMLARQAGLSVVSLVRGGFFVHPDKEMRTQRIEWNLRLLQDAVDMGAPLIVLVCGADPSVRIADARKQVEAGLAAILPTAEKEGIRLAIEPLHPMYAGDRSVINTMREALDLCESLKSPKLGIAVDVYHVWWDPELEVQIARAGSSQSIFAFHVCDWKTPLEDMLEDRGLMGEGCIDIQSIRHALEQAGFEGFAEVEIFSKKYWAMDQDRWLEMVDEAWKTWV
jgi:sugar phosphate isomerase/epimerase